MRFNIAETLEKIQIGFRDVSGVPSYSTGRARPLTPEQEHEIEQVRKIDKIVNEKLSTFIRAEP
jgi:hypothetical protein